MSQFIAKSISPRSISKSWPSVRTATVIAVGLGAWFAWAAYAGVTGVFAAGPDQLFRPILLSVAGPVAIFLVAYGVSPRFRAYVLTRDLRLLTSLQHWRIIGFAFLALYAADVLPGEFAWAAGLGDVFMGLTTPLVLLALDRRAGFVRSKTFIAWNLFGLLDFVVAAAAATLASGALPGIVAPDALTSAPMEVWPLLLFPSFIVPLFVFAHLSVLFRVVALRRANRTRRSDVAQVPREVFGPLGARDLPFQVGQEG